MNINSFFQKTILGLDIQADGIRIIKIRKKRFTKSNKYFIEKKIKKPLPPHIFIEGEIAQWEKLQSCLAEFVLEQGLYNQSVAICLPANLVRMENIQLPNNLSDIDIEAEICSYLQSDLSLITEALHIDFTVLSQQKDSAEVFFVAACDKYLPQYVACVQGAGLKVKVIDVDIFVAKRSSSFFLQSKKNETNTMLTALEQAEYLLAFGLAMRELPPW